MLSKIYKAIKKEDSIITIYGSNRDLKTYYGKPDWSNEEELYFKYRGIKYFLSEFMRIDNNASEWMKEFHGYSNDSAFSGVLVKISDDGETVKAYTFIS